VVGACPSRLQQEEELGRRVGLPRAYGQPVGRELTGRVLAPSSGEGIDHRAHLDIDQPGQPDHRLPPCARQGPRYSTSPEIDVSDRAFGERLLHTDVGDHHAPAWFQDAEDLAIGAKLVGAEVDDAVADDDVSPFVFDR